MDRVKMVFMVSIFMMVMFLIHSSVVSSTTFSIDTSRDWKSFDSQQNDWNQLTFDDSGWRNSYEDYTTHPGSEFDKLVNAKTIWDWPYSGDPDGTNGPLKAYFRYSISLDGDVENAQLSYAVDDALIVYVNGQMAYAHAGAGNTNTPESLVSG